MPLDQKVAIVDPDEAIEELKLADADYRRVERLVNMASVRLERVCNTVFRRRTITRTFEGDGTPILDLGGPIIAVNWVTIDGVVEPAKDYTVDKEGGRVIRTGGWPVGIRNVAADAVMGWDPIPHEVVEACLALVRRSASAAAGDLKAERIGDYSYERFDPRGESDVPDDVEALVLPFRRWRFG